MAIKCISIYKFIIAFMTWISFLNQLNKYFNLVSKIISKNIYIIKSWE